MFVKDLYRDEIRAGWLVMADTKKVWNRQLEICREVDRICRKHAINYWAGYGTLIGAARHKGFIPWDDDIDLMMMRPEYNRFLTVLDELNESFAVGLNRSSVLRISHEQTTLLDDDYFSGKEKPTGLMIEIFPLDVALDGTRSGFFATNALNELMGTIYNFDAVVKHVQTGGKIFNDWEFIEIVHALGNLEDQWKFFNIYAENLFEQSSSVFWIEDSARNMNRPAFPKRCFRETIYLPFEMIELPAPIGYDEILTAYYGNWRTPVNDGGKRLGLVHSTDIPYREFLSRIDKEKFLSK